MLRWLSSSKHPYFVINTSISIKIIFQYIHIRAIHYFNNDNIYLLYRDRYELLKNLDSDIGFNPVKARTRIGRGQVGTEATLGIEHLY